MAKNKEAVLFTLNITLRLLAICLAVAALVALVFTVTKDPIAEGDRARKEEAIRTLFADAASFDTDSTLQGDGVNEVYRVKNAAGVTIGLCIDYTGVSEYGGDVNMMVGVDPSGRVIGLQVISHAETFIDRYTDENGCYTGIDQPDGADVSAGATMSYRAIREAIHAIEALCAPTKETPDEVPMPESPPNAEIPEPEVLNRAEMQHFFADGSVFLRQTRNEGGQVKTVYAVKNEGDALLGHCVIYTATGGHNGSFLLLMAVNPDGEVFGVRVLQHFENSMDFYLDSNNCFDPEQDFCAGATETYDAVQNAILAVEALSLGGAV